MPEAAHPLPGPVPSHLFSGRLPPGPVVMAGFGSVGSMRAICLGRTSAAGEHLPRENMCLGRTSASGEPWSRTVRQFRRCTGFTKGVVLVVSQLFRSCFARCFTCEIDHAEVWFGVASPVTMTYAVGSAIAYISLVNR